ncbi:hypothetical protein AWB68_07891 [Caballeronia choica]|jgi:uncharacterized lipoprotein YmbA|uniref:ABC-type transport auxiliary lipoprotein component domain-containing protein n=1 Tax=Caballeronia choica TaxID=326476 RepID=A0A158KYJ5_9BURK|nr:PqiC family protein [Caballeronia choica]SAL86045.1 hypothetical protein AWB68_07891 [Caballeronia choica]
MKCRDGRRATTALTALAVAILLHGCAHSPATHYVTLSSVPARAPLAAAPIAPVQLTALHIPAELDRPEVVTEPAPNQLAIAEDERWGAPLAQVMRLALVRDLMTRLPDGTFVPPDLPAPAGTRALVVTVIDVESRETEGITLHAAWTLVARHPDHVVLIEHAALQAPIAGTDSAAQAAALSEILGELADRMAASISAR